MRQLLFILATLIFSSSFLSAQKITGVVTEFAKFDYKDRVYIDSEILIQSFTFEIIKMDSLGNNHLIIGTTISEITTYNTYRIANNVAAILGVEYAPNRYVAYDPFFNSIELQYTKEHFSLSIKYNEKNIDEPNAVHQCIYTGKIID